MASEIPNLKEQGEIAAEKGEQELALAQFERALITAIGKQDYREAVNVLGHHMHVYKKYFQETGNEAYMELFYMDTQTGLRLAEKYNVQGQPKSVMQLRAGNYFEFTGDFEQAVKQYQLALEELNKTSQEAPETNGEYQSHYALGLVKLGKTEQGMHMFGQALGLVANNHTLRPFHHDVIHSGVLLRQAEAHLLLGEKDAAQKTMDQAKPLVDNLASEHNMPDRQKQWQELQQKILH